MQLSLSKGGVDRLAIYSFMFAAAEIFHQLCNSWLPGSLILDVLVTLAALALLFRPRSVILLLILSVLSFTNGFVHIPHIHNHMFFQAMLDLLVTLSVSYVLLAQYKKGELAESLSSAAVRERMFDSFAPVARTGLIILYFFAIFHKLNWTFFDPKYSPSVSLLKETFHPLPNFNLNNTLKITSIWATFVFEGGIAVLLCFRRTRVAGILVALVFHLTLSINPFRVEFSSFSSMIYAVLFTFTPRNFPERISQLFYSVRQWALGKERKILLFAAIVLLIFLSAGFLAAHIARPRNAITVLFIFWWLIITTVFLSVIAFFPAANNEPGNIFRPRWPVQWAVPIILIFNGMNPYLGLKTDYSFNMFTGLRTEGGKINHFFMPQWLKVATYQDDLVQILATDHPQLIKYGRDTKLLLTYFDFQRIVRKKNKDFFVEYKRNGKPFRLEVKNAVYSDPEVLKPHSWFADKFLGFKPITTQNKY